MFLAPNFFGGEPPKFLKSIYSIPPVFDHVAKFQGDRSRDLGESVAKKNHLRQNISPSGNWRSGRPNNNVRNPFRVQKDLGAIVLHLGIHTSSKRAFCLCTDCLVTKFWRLSAVVQTRSIIYGRYSQTLQFDSHLQGILQLTSTSSDVNPCPMSLRVKNSLGTNFKSLSLSFSLHVQWPC